MTDTNTLNQLSPEHLRTFVVAADAGSFTKAAPLVHRTQSAVSMQMKKLEDDLQRPLFRREGRGVALTNDGETLYRYAKRLLTLHDEALAVIARPKVDGVVRFGAPEDYAAQFLPQALKRFAVTHPTVEVEVYCDATPNLRQLYNEGALDVMLTTEEDTNGPNRQRLDLTWIVAENGGPLSTKPLPLALFHAGCPYRRNALSSLEEAGIDYRIAYSSPSMAGVVAAVQAGLAIAPVMSASTIPGCRKAGRRDGIPTIPSAAIGLHVSPDPHNDAIASFHTFIGNELELDTI